MTRIEELHPAPSSVELLSERVTGIDHAPLDEREAYARLGEFAGWLPSEMVDFLISFRESRIVDAVVIRGLPVGATELVPTPADPIEAPRIVRGFQALSLGILSILGTPFAYQTQQGGRLVNNIAPSKSADDVENIGIGSSKPFDFHTEDAFMENPPSFLQLSCVRNPNPTPTIVSGVPKDMPAEVEQTLREHAYVVGTNPAQAQWSGISSGPVIYGSADRPYMRFNAINTHTVAVDDVARYENALAYLRAALSENPAAVTHGSGDVLIVNNYVLCHARSAFQATHDGRDRWLQRIVAYRDPRSVASLTEYDEYPTLVPGK